MSSVHRWSAGLLALATAAAFAAPASGQQRPTTDPGVALLTAPTPVLAPATPFAPVLVTESATSLPIAPVPAMSEKQSVALMIVGGAALIVGALVDGDAGTIIMVAGGVTGLIGLYQYLR